MTLTRKTPMNRGTSQLTRTGFKRQPARSLNPHSGEVVRSGMKRSRKRRRSVVGLDAKYIAACKGEPCYLRIEGVCCGDWRTVVDCHSNQGRHGKGMGITAEHRYTVPGCATCHVFIDQSGADQEEKFVAWDRAFEIWEPRRAAKMGMAQPELEAT